jgi:hypothetical protein
MTSCIMTSTLVAIYFASCGISKRGHPRMASFSAASFSALHSSFKYLRFFYALLATVYFVVVSRRCMYNPSFSSCSLSLGYLRRFFFSRLTPFFLLTLDYVFLKRGRLTRGGGSARGLEPPMTGKYRLEQRFPEIGAGILGECLGTSLEHDIQERRSSNGPHPRMRCLYSPL